eukprot:COSAG03_NODE_12769_length_531_cov_1555.932870_2_plen_34_part_01
MVLPTRLLCAGLAVCVRRLAMSVATQRQHDGHYS